LRIRTKHGSQALRSLDTSGTKLVAAVGFLAVADEVHGGFGDGKSGQQARDEGCKEMHNGRVMEFGAGVGCVPIAIIEIIMTPSSSLRMIDHDHELPSDQL
jgi:hypothetical protein